MCLVYIFGNRLTTFFVVGFKMAYVTRTGRPPIDAEKRRGAPVPVRFTDEERELVEDAAAADGMSLSAWIRARAVTAARRANRKRPYASG